MLTQLATFWIKWDEIFRLIVQQQRQPVGEYTQVHTNSTHLIQIKKQQIMRKVIIFGGYGNFGKILSRSFMRDKIPVNICGRNSHKLDQEVTNLSCQFDNSLLSYTVKNINDDLTDILKDSNNGLLINTCGPFQTANYSVVEQCIQEKVDYIDLADGRDFVNDMTQYDLIAKQRQVTVITGASSVPGLSSAIVEEFKGQFSKIQSLEYGISPGQRTTRGGNATVKAVLGYVGKPIKPYGSLKNQIYGWQDLYQEQYPTLGSRLFGNCEVPDLDLFPKIYGINNIRFSAGMQSKVLHMGIWLTSWLIRFGLPLDLPKYSEFLLKFSHACFDWMGTDEGGLHMTIRGIDKADKQIERKWYIIVRKGHGPNVPVSPAIILGKKIWKNNLKLAGVNSCVGLVKLSQYLKQLERYNVQVFTNKRYL